jgi:c-di-GMP-binding flagellar brake protein YcgR
MADLPKINSLVRIEMREGQYIPSRVEAVDGNLYTVGRPSYSGDLEVADPGTEMAMIWFSERGVYGVPARLVTQHRDRIPVWQIEITGEVELKQRRKFVRVPFVAPVTLAVGKDAENAVEGTLVDLSEGGIRCVLRSAVREDIVAVTIDDDESPITVSGWIVRVTPQADGSQHVVVVFDPSPGDADRIRRLVMREQLRLRRRERELA